MMLRRALLAGVALLAALHSAKADFTFTLGTGATGFSFTSTTGGTALCAAASTHCFASVPINTAGAQLFTSGAPGLVTLTGTNNINNIAGTISLPTGAATQTTLASVLTALGSPFQAGGTVTANLGTLNGAATAANQTNASQKSQIVDGSGSVIASTSNALNAFVTNATPGLANNADGIAAVAASATSPVPVNNYAYVWNGSTWDRMVGTTAGVTVRNPTAANLNATIVGTGTFVTQSALTATEVHVGEVSSNQIRVDVAQTVTASSAYTSGNAIGGLMTIANSARVSGSLGAAGTGGIIQQVVANSKSLQTTQVDVFLFNSNPSGSTCTDKTAFVLATADFDKVIGVASIPGTAANNSGWFGGGTGSVGQANNLAMAFDLASGTSVFACAVTRGTPTFTATSDISFKYQILRN